MVSDKSPCMGMKAVLAKIDHNSFMLQNRNNRNALILIEITKQKSSNLAS